MAVAVAPGPIDLYYTDQYSYREVAGKSFRVQSEGVPVTCSRIVLTFITT